LLRKPNKAYNKYMFINLLYYINYILNLFFRSLETDALQN